MDDTREKAPSADGAVLSQSVRPEGFEPPTYWSVAYSPVDGDFCPDCGCKYHAPGPLFMCRDGACDCHHESWSLDDEHALRLVMDAAVTL